MWYKAETRSGLLWKKLADPALGRKGGEQKNAALSFLELVIYSQVSMGLTVTSPRRIAQERVDSPRDLPEVIGNLWRWLFSPFRPQVGFWAPLGPPPASLA